MFKEIAEQSFAERELEVLRFWQDKQIFEKSVKGREDRTLFSFYDGPPFATGLPHYGHILAGTIKDVVPRYKTMKGYYVPRRFGWDCHGLPVENEIEKAQNLTGKDSIEQFGIAAFNEECRKIVLRYTEEWKETVNRMGRWVDFKKTYRTMDPDFMESVWWVFKQLYDKGLVYEGFKVMPFSAKLGTPLSNFEATQNYKEVDDPSVVVAFKLVDDPETALLCWTTTPWTLVSNLAITAGPEIDYIKVQHKESGKKFIIGKERLSAFASPEDFVVLETMKGKKLEGLRYTPLFSYFLDRAEEGAFQLLVDSFVTTEEGTGLVHTAPAFGEADFFACQKAGIEVVCPIDANGHFTEEVADYVGIYVKDADKEIIKRLKKEGALFHQATIRHRYPFCWRSDTPLIYRVVSTWFVAVEQVKEKLLSANAKIHWMPAHIKEGRFGKWLEAARDWAISRNRYWGTPIPLWRAEDGEVIAIGSVAELEQLTKSKVTDLHRHFIDQLVIVKEGKEFHRITEVFDCWFESGSMPYAQLHYPFENKEYFEKAFPADFIAEGLDQTRGWFYTLTVLAAALYDQPAFKNVIVNGIILAADGNKMSKRLKNYPDPLLVTEHFGADAIRLYMLNSPAVRADDLCFAERGVELVLRQVLIPLWNSYSFLVTYARICEWKPTGAMQKPAALIDQWILSLLNKLVKTVEEAMDLYDLNAAVEPFVSFVDQLTNWYIRRSRRRFWADEDSQDRRDALATLHHVILTLSKVAAPFIPFLTDAIYRNVCEEREPESVHLCDYPTYNAAWRNEHLEEVMMAVQSVVSLGHGLRKEHKLKVRQPLPAVRIASTNSHTMDFLREQQHLIADELNVKEVIFSDDESEFVSLKAKPNFRVLGKKVGKLMPAVQKAVEAFTRQQLQALLEGRAIKIVVEGNEVILTPEDMAVERQVHGGMVAANAGDVAIILDTTLTEALLMEGLAREIVNKINTMRRESGFAVVDRIIVTMETTQRVRNCFTQYDKYICNEVLATRVEFAQVEGEPVDLNGEATRIALKKTGS